MPAQRATPIDPVLCGLISTRLGAVITQFETLGIRVPTHGRVRTAARLLAEIAKLGHFPPSSADRLQIGNAIRLGIELNGIARALRAGIPIGQKEVIQQCMRGTLSDSGRNAATQAQASLFAGSLLTAGGRSIRVPIPNGRKSPDYVISVDTCEFGLEVKRPAGQRGLCKALEEAVSQVATFSSAVHAVYLDTTDCVEWPVVACINEETRGLVKRLVANVDLQATACLQRKPALFARLGVLVTAGAPILWPTREANPCLLQSWVYSVQPNACHGLVVTHSDRLVETFISGARQLGGMELEDLCI